MALGAVVSAVTTNARTCLTLISYGAIKTIKNVKKIKKKQRSTQVQLLAVRCPWRRIPWRSDRHKFRAQRCLQVVQCCRPRVTPTRCRMDAKSLWGGRWKFAKQRNLTLDNFLHLRLSTGCLVKVFSGSGGEEYTLSVGLESSVDSHS